MLNILFILIGKFISTISQILNMGSGSTWPGHLALMANKNFIHELKAQNSKLKTILISGTNGKTTTGKLIQEILQTDGKKVFQNSSGANLLNGVASSLIVNSNILGKIDEDFAIFEIDENTLPLILNEFTPDYLILLNLFRDQLDRYGEVNTIANRWKKALLELKPSVSLLLNADDPQVAYLGKGLKNNVFYFGLNDKKYETKNKQHAVDSAYCPNCSEKLNYNLVYFSHLGDWSCLKCSYQRPKLTLSKNISSPLFGVYNQYNLNAAVLFTNLNNINDKIIDSALHEFTPAFGRQEVLEFPDGKKVQIFLSKNPTSFNQSLRTVKEFGGKNLLLVLNDRIPDGRDISWIWDIDTEELANNHLNIVVSGDRVYDMGIRLKYSSSYEFLISNFEFSMKTSNFKFQIEENLKKAIMQALTQTPKTETLYILPTYSAMLEVRKILTGKKIL